MSWVPESEYRYSWTEWILMKLIRCGEVPQHVGFIMDGNRRFARINKMDKVIDGHSKGFDKLAQTLQWCKDLDIDHVTVYAFSIENFKRSKEEVDSLLDLARDKFRRLLTEVDRIKAEGVKIKVIGALHLLPADLRELIEEAEEKTFCPKAKRTLNVAFAYTSREEITEAIRQSVNNDHGDISQHLYEKKEVDLLIRTSGETRLSDFMLWQSAFAVTYFTEVLWPDFTVLNLLAGIFYFQRHRRKIVELKDQLRNNNNANTVNN